jgi:hypothetical protein
MRVPTRAIPLVIVVLFAAFIVLVLFNLPHPPEEAVTPTATSTTTSSGSQAPVDERSQWHGVMGYQAGEFCARCHASPFLDFYKASWSRAGAGWNLTVTPTMPDVALLAVQASPEPIAAPALKSQSNDPWPVGTPWQGTFQIEGGRNVSVLLEASPASPPDSSSVTQPLGLDNTTAGLPTSFTDYSAQPNLELVSPSGRHVKAHRLEASRAIAFTDQAEPGTWTFTALVSQATIDNAPVASLHGSLTVVPLRGPVAGLVSPLSYATYMGTTAPPVATMWFPAQADGGPPSLNLAAFPYHDHSNDRGERQDVYDLSFNDPYLRSFKREPGEAFVPDPPSESALNQIWGGKTNYTLWQNNLSEYWAYTTDAQGEPHGSGDYGHARDSPAKGNLLPGAKRLRISADWNPPIDIPDLGAKVSPGNSADWFEAPTILESRPGHREWSIDVDPAWWDSIGSGYWCANLYRPLVPNTIYSGAINAQLTVVAQR